MRYLGTAALLLLQAVGVQAQDLRIEHVTVISPERARPARDTTINIHDGRIAATSGGPVIDGHGLYLSPGLIDSHVHLAQIPGMTDGQEATHPDIARAARDQMPRSFLLAGFTTLIDLNSDPPVMARWKAHDLVPDTYWCGGAILRDGYPMNFFPAPARYEIFPYTIVDTDSSAVASVAHMKADGALCVKTFFEHGFGADRNLPVPRLETMRSLVRAAHAAGLPVFMHANAAEAQTFALDAGADIIAHGMWNWKPSMDTVLGEREMAILDRVVATNTGWQPTIQVLYGERDASSTSFLADKKLARFLPASLIAWYGKASAEGKPESQAQANAIEAPWITRVKRATGYLATHHARLLFGTDTPSGLTYANPPGLNAWLEMQNLVDAGLSPAQIFEAATLSNARAVGLEKDIGTVATAKRANLLLLREDPTQTIHAYTTIVKVILGGRVVDPHDLEAR